MALYFDESFYLQTKLKQLEVTGSKGPNGQTWTENTLRKAMSDIGLTPEQHYESYGRVENVNPNAYFNESEYLTTKLAALREHTATASEWAGKGVNELVKVMESLNLTPAQHYERFGAFETRGDGTLLNPSNAFDANAYFAAKLLQMQTKGEMLNGKPAAQVSVADVVAAFKVAGISPTTHYDSFGAKEANAQGVALVQTVPIEQRVANDGYRGSLGQNVPTNYNPASKPPAEATASAVDKPADVGGLASSSISPKVTPPAKAAPVPGDSNYVKPPAGLADTNASPVIAPTTNGNGSAATDCWATSNGDGTADLIRPDGQPGGTIPIDPNNPSVIPPNTPTPTPPTPPTPPVPPVTPKISDVTGTVDDAAHSLTLTGTAKHGEVTVSLDAAALKVALAEKNATQGPTNPADATAAITAIDSKIVSTFDKQVVIDISKAGALVTKAAAHEALVVDTSHDVLMVSKDSAATAFTQDGVNFKGFEELRLIAGTYDPNTRTISKYDTVSAVGATAAVTAKLGAEVKNYTGGAGADAITLGSLFDGRGILDGGAGTDTLTLEAGLTVTAGVTPDKNLTIKNFETVTASAVTNAITANLGMGVNNYAGGTAADTINLVAGFNGTGSLAGGAGADVLDIKTAVVAGADMATQTLTITGFETVNVTEEVGVVAKLGVDVNAYTGKATGTGADKLTLVTGFNGTGVIDGGSGINTLTVADDVATGTYKNFNTVTVEGAKTFIGTLGKNITNFTGGTGIDTITIGADFSSTGVIDGGATGVNVLNVNNTVLKDGVSGALTTFKNFGTITVGAGIAVEAQLGKGITTYTGNSAADKMTLGADFDGTTAAAFNGGTGADALHIGVAVSSAAFTITGFETVDVKPLTGTVDVTAKLGAGVENYTGGAGKDEITLTSAFDTFTGTIDGGAGTMDTLTIGKALTTGMTITNFETVTAGANAVTAKISGSVDNYTAEVTAAQVLTIDTGFTGKGLWNGGGHANNVLTISTDVAASDTAMLSLTNFKAVNIGVGKHVALNLGEGIDTYTGNTGVDTLVFDKSFAGNASSKAIGGKGADKFMIEKGFAAADTIDLVIAQGDSGYNSLIAVTDTKIAKAVIDTFDTVSFNADAGKFSLTIGGYTASNAGSLTANNWHIAAPSSSATYTKVLDNAIDLLQGTYNVDGTFTVGGSGKDYILHYDADGAVSGAITEEAVLLIGVGAGGLTATIDSGTGVVTLASTVSV